MSETTFPRTAPAADIIEREDGFHLFLDMPGVQREALVLDLNDNELTVSGRTAYPAQAEGERVHALEFGDCEYRRAFTLSDMVDRERIRATLTNGVLEIFLPKAEKALPKRIEIQAGG
ncbi:MAG: Hsp20/alpha crystallin family protein [Desulfovibrionaceae bacterium]|jgi:HSP20 family molecular chaperone IbpA|nr:Hsp20/alpha crystallin family protein [Desulfovibrionaceae bacterium]